MSSCSNWPAWAFEGTLPPLAELPLALLATGWMDSPHLHHLLNFFDAFLATLVALHLTPVSESVSGR